MLPFNKKIRCFFIIFFTILISGCVDLPDEVILPEWDVELNIPLLNRQYVFDEIVSSPEFFSINEDENGVYLINSDVYKGKTNVAQYIKVPTEISLENNLVFASTFDTTRLFITYPNGIELDSAKFLDGNISFSIENPSDLPVNLVVLFPGIIDPQKNQLSIETVVQPHSSSSISYDLKDHEYRLPQNQVFNHKNSLQVIPSIHSLAPPGTFITLDFYTSDFLFEKVTGKLPRTLVKSELIPVDVNFGEVKKYRDRIFIKEAVFKLKANYETLFSNPFVLGVHNISLVGKRNDGNTKTLRFNDNSTINFDLLGGSSELVFTEQNSNINEFITYFPDSLFLQADFYINPQNSTTSNSTSISDSIKFEADFSTTSSFAINNINNIDTVTIDLNYDDREKIRNGNNAEFNIEIENAIPLNSYLKITLTDQFYNPLFVITKDVNNSDSVSVSGGNTNSAGDITSPTISQIKVELSQEEINHIANSYYAIVSTTFGTEGASLLQPKFVNIRSSDWIRIKCYGSVDYRFDPDEEN